MKCGQRIASACHKAVSPEMRRFNRAKKTIVAAGVIFLAAGNTPAQTLAEEEILTPAAGLHGSIGVGVGVRPEYEGAKERKAGVMSRINLLYGDRLFIVGTSAGINALNFTTQRGLAVAAGPFLAFRRGRKEGDNAALQGLGDIDAALDAGVFARLRVQDWQASMNVKKNVTQSGKGATVNLSASRNMTLSPDLRLRASVEAAWVSKDYMKTFFGVDAQQSARSGLAPYSPAAGFKDVGAGLLADYTINRHWGGFTTLRFKRLVGDAADSPIVASVGKKNQIAAGIGIQYRF